MREDLATIDAKSETTLFLDAASHSAMISTAKALAIFGVMFKSPLEESSVVNI